VSCHEIGPLLSGWVDDELDSDERAEVQAHLDACADCRLELDELEALGELTLGAVPLPGEAAWAALDEGLRAGVRREAPRGEVLSLQTLLGLGAIAAALLLCFRLVWDVSAPRVHLQAQGRLTFPSLEHREPVWEAEGSDRPQAFDPRTAQGAQALEALPAAAVAALTSHGLVQVPAPALRLSELYALEDDARRPAALATADASALLVGAAAGRLALTIEAELIVPETRRVIGALSIELRRLELRARDADVRAAARSARERMAVVALLEGLDVDLPAPALRRVEDEVARVRSAQGVSESPLDGERFDYSRCRPRGLYVSQGDHARAMAWLSQRGLRLSVDRPGELRAACLIAMALSEGRLPDGRTALAGQARLEAALQVLFGEPDGLTPLDVLYALRQGLGEPRPRLARLSDRRALAAVARHADQAAAQRRDRVRGRDDDGVPRAFLLGHLRSLEGQVFSGLTPRGRPRPSSLDLLVVLGSRRARTAVSAAGLDAPGYDRAVRALAPRVRAWSDASLPVPLVASLEQGRLWSLAPLVERRPPSPVPFQASAPYRDRLLLAGLAALSAPQPAPDVLPGEPLPGPVPIVEPLPRLHARLAFTAERLRRVALRLLEPSDARDRAVAILERVGRLEEALRDASLDALAGRRPADTTVRALRGYAATMRELGPAHPFAAEGVYELGGQVLHRVSYRLDRLWVTARDPLTWRPRLAVGAALAACELLSAQRLTPLEVAGHAGVAIPAWASHHLETLEEDR
jgi:hypothetical protein